MTVTDQVRVSHVKMTEPIDAYPQEMNPCPART